VLYASKHLSSVSAWAISANVTAESNSIGNRRKSRSRQRLSRRLQFNLASGGVAKIPARTAVTLFAAMRVTYLQQTH
jgi:hypothetical protein